MKSLSKWGTRNFTLRRKGTWSFTFRPRNPRRSLWDQRDAWNFYVRPRYAWSSTVRRRNTCSFIVSQTSREYALKRCVNFHSRAKACMKLQSHEGIREISVWDKRVGLHANAENKGMCEVPLPDQGMREISLRDQVMREVSLSDERISEVSVWDQGAREVSLSNEATVKFDSEIQKDVNRKRNVDIMVWPTVHEDWPPLPFMQSQSSV